MSKCLTGKSLILATKPYAKENRFKSWMHTIVVLTLLLFCFSATLWMPNIWLKALFSILAGLITVRFFIIYHDYLHHSVLQGSWLARFIMTIFGLYILAPTSIWKRSHDYHHKHNSKLYTADIGSFPIVTKEKYLALTKRERLFYLAIRHPFTIMMGHFSMFIVGMSLRSFLSSPRKHIDSLIALVLYAAAIVVIAVFIGWQGCLFTIFIPYFISHGLGAYLFYAQHNFPGVFFNDKDGWTYEAAALESSSYMKMSPVMAWFCGNIGYHHIHHLNARIPFYRLPEAMRALPELQTAKTTSLHPRDILKCFRLKVWDPETRTMIGHRELRIPMRSPAAKMA